MSADGWALLVRVGAGLGKLVLAAALAVLLARESGLLPRFVRAAWVVMAAHALLLAIQVVVLEGLSVAGVLFPSMAEGLAAFRNQIYNEVYLLFAWVGATVPAVVLALLADRRILRGLGLVLAVGALLLAGAGALAGAPTGWSSLLSVTRGLSYVAIAALLSFWAGFALGHLRPLDRFVLTYVGLRTVFVLLLPIQEALFRLLGLEQVQGFWSVHLLLQALLYWGGVAVVLRLLGRLDERRPPEPIRLYA